MSGTTGRGGVAGSSALMFSGTLVSRLLGMVRSPLLLGAAIGANLGVSDAFAVANKLPNVVYLLIAGGVLNAILVPALVRAMAKDDDGGQAYANRLVTVFGVGLGAITLLLTVAAHVLVWVYAGAMSPQWFDVAVAFAWWTVPQLFFYGMYTMLGQVLNARGIFGPYMWAPAVNNVVAIAGLLLYLWVYGTAGSSDAADPAAWTPGRIALLAGTATLGIVAQALVLVVPLRRSGFRYRFDLTLRGSGLGRASRTATWVFAAVLVGQVSNILVSQAAAGARGRAADGDPAALLGVAGNQAYDNAYLLYSLPTSLVVVSLVTALFTRMSTNAATGETGRVRDDTSLALRVVGVFTVFVAPAMIVLALPMTRILNAAVSYEEVRSIATVLACMCVGMVAVGAWTVLQRVYYAFEAARHLFWIQVPTVVVLAAGALLAMTVPPAWTVPVIGLSMAASNSLGVVIAYARLRRYLPDLDAGHVLRAHARVAAAAAGPVLIGWGVLHLWGTDSSMGVMDAIWRTLVVGTLMAVLYAAALHLLRVPEFATLLRPMGRLTGGLARRVPGPLGRLLARTGGAAAAGTDPAPVPTASPTPAPARGDSIETPVERKDTVSPVRSEPHESDDVLEANLVGGRYLVDDFVDPAPGLAGEPAEDLILHRAVRLLRLDPGAARTPEVLDAARRAALVRDSRLLAVLDVGQDEDVAWVVTEEVPGTGLDALVAEGPLGVDDARTVVGEVASALEAASLHGVHHLRLEPDHVRVTRAGEVVVVGVGTHAALLGTSEGRDASEMDLMASAQADGTDLVRLLHLALTGRPAPRDGGLATLDLPEGTPPPVRRLVARTFVDDEPPVGPTSVVRALAPWEPLEAAADVEEKHRGAGAMLAALRRPRGDRREHGATTGDATVPPAPVTVRAEEDLIERASHTPPPPPPAAEPAPEAPEESVTAPGDEPEDVAVPRDAPVTDETPARAPAEETAGPAAPSRPERWGARAAEWNSRATAWGSSVVGRVRARATAPRARTTSASPTPAGSSAPLAGTAHPTAARTGTGVHRVREPLPPRHRRLALAIVGGLMLLLLALALATLLSTPGERAPREAAPATSAPSTSEAPPSAAPTEPPRVAGVTLADAGQEHPDHPEALPAVVDGDPSTAWRSLWYEGPTYAGVKDGIGLVVDLAQPAQVSSVTLDVAGSGGAAVLRDAPGGEVLTTGDAGLGPATTITLDEPRVLEQLVVEFTELPRATENGRYMIALHELSVG